MRTFTTLIAAAALLVAVAMPASCVAQDPADGWMAYAVGTTPAGTERITFMQMKWVVSNNAQSSFAFYSPWFGMDPADNLNLIQPVNPWGGSSWSMYTEYYQWSPSSNSNSQQQPVNAGQTLIGTLTYDSSSDSYFLNQTVKETGATSTQTVQCQDGKKFKIPYVVYEKLFSCNDYPPDEKVTFKDIVVECDGKDCTKDIKWEAKVKDANCDMTAHIESPTQISITWDTSGKSAVDHLTPQQQFDLNYHGWASHVPGLKRPEA